MGPDIECDTDTSCNTDMTETRKIGYMKYERLLSEKNLDHSTRRSFVPEVGGTLVFKCYVCVYVGLFACLSYFQFQF